MLKIAIYFYADAV